MNKRFRSGFGLVEALLSAALLSIFATAFLGAVLYAQEGGVIAGDFSRAVFIADEGLQAVRNISQSGFLNLTDGTYGLATSTNIWSLAGSVDTVDIFSREISISSVDSNTKLVTSTVAWQQAGRRAGRVSLATRFTNWARSAGAWFSPRESTSINFAGNQDGVKVAVLGNYAYVVRSGGNPNFAVVEITSPDSPQIRGTLALSGVPTNIYVSGNFAYVTNTSNTQEMQIINISNPNSPVQVGSIDLSGSGDGLGVFVSGFVAYVTRAQHAGPEFHSVNVSDPAFPVALGSFGFAGNVSEIAIIGTDAYVASGEDGAELYVINIANPALLQTRGSLNLPGTTDAITIVGTSQYMFLGQGNFIRAVNVSNPANPLPSGSLDLGGAINDLALYSVDNTLLFAATSNANLEFQVVDISTPANPSPWSSVNLSGAALGAAYSESHDRVLVAGASNNSELSVIAPQ